MSRGRSSGGVGAGVIVIVLAVLAATGQLKHFETTSHKVTEGLAHVVSHGSSASTGDSTGTSGSNGSGTDKSTATSGDYTLVQYPAAGFSGFYAQTNAAKKSIDMEMYELTDTTEQADLVAAVKRHVTVRVLLDQAFSGKQANTPAYSYLSSHGVTVKWAPAGYIFHIKVTTFDGATSDVSTANLTSKYYAGTRDAEIIDTDASQVKAIEATFAKDWTGTIPKDDTVQGAGLVWSPNTGSGTAEDALVSQISAAKKTVYFTSEELSDSRIYGALAADAKRGVACEVVMTNSSEWDTGFRAVTAAGCKVHVYPDSTKAIYIHEKLILDDAGTSSASLLIGSQNASYYSLTRNREAGLLLTNSVALKVIASVAATFKSDYAGALVWTP